MKPLKKVLLRKASRSRIDIEATLIGVKLIPVNFTLDGATYSTDRVLSSDDRISQWHFDVQLVSGAVVHLIVERSSLECEVHTVTTVWPDKWKGWSDC